MKLSLFLLILFSTMSCSFDDKTGIWKNERNSLDNKSGSFSDFKKIGVNESSFNEEIKLKKKLVINIPKKIKRVMRHGIVEEIQRME